MGKYDLLSQGISLVNWAEESDQVGTPSMVLLPARHFYFKVIDKQYKISIPREGSYNAIDSTYFSKEDGSFNLLDVHNSVLYLPAISKVLFATKQYPNLKQNQLFAPIALKFNSDTVDIYGQIIELTTADNN